MTHIPCNVRITQPSEHSSVHPVESTDGRQNALASRPGDCLAYAFRHSSWEAHRHLTYTALAALTLHALLPASRLERFSDCGRSAWVLQHKIEPNRYRIALDCCHDRFCVPCSNARGHIVAENLARKLGPDPHRLLTLTLKANHDPLNAQLDRLFRCFKRLRGRSLWKDRCRGGAAFLELTYNADTTCWHPHLHVVIEGKFLPHAAVKSAWLDITGDSSIVDIRPIRERQAAITYITKHVTKAVPASVVTNSDALRTAIYALHGRKTLFCFGCWSRWKLLDPHDPSEWVLFSHANGLGFGLPANHELEFEILDYYERWKLGDEPNDFTIRAPPQRDFDEPFDA